MRPTQRDRGLIAGLVGVDATSARILQGSGFTVSRAATGVYDLELPPGYRIVAAVPHVTSGAAVLNATFGRNRVGCFVSNTGTGVDANFGFIASAS